MEQVPSTAVMIIVCGALLLFLLAYSAMLAWVLWGFARGAWRQLRGDRERRGFDVLPPAQK